MFTSEFCFESIFSDFDSGFPPWDYTEPPFLFDTPFPDQAEEPVAVFLQESITSSSGSDTSNPEYPMNPISDSSKPNQNCSKHLSSVTSHETILLASIMDERKRRRTQSNRESARRSRIRKQKHMENLGTQMNRQKRENLELMNQLKVVVSQNEAVCRENEHLRMEAMKFRQRMWDIYTQSSARPAASAISTISIDLFAWQNNPTSLMKKTT